MTLLPWLPTSPPPRSGEDRFHRSNTLYPCTMAYILPDNLSMTIGPQGMIVSIAKVATLGCMLLLLPQCAWIKPQAQRPTPRDHPTVYHPSPSREKYQNGAARDTIAMLKNRLKEKDLELAKLKAENAELAELKTYLEEELNNTKRDLEYVERQFLTFENRIQSIENKASAVAAMAEARIGLERYRRTQSARDDSLTIREVKEKLEKSDECIRSEQYAAAVYYARRAQKILDATARKKRIDLRPGDTRIVSVNTANLRQGPGTRYAVLDELPFGTIVVQLDSKGKWSKIKTRDGRQGWVHRTLIK